MNNNKLRTNRNISHGLTDHDKGSKTTLSLLLLASVALGGCAVRQSPAINAKSTAATQANPNEIRISSTEFNYKPARIKVKEGQAITLTLDNRQGAIEHDFVINKLGIRLFAKAGQETSQKLVFKLPGDYVFTCSLPGHEIPACRGN